MTAVRNVCLVAALLIVAACQTVPYQPQARDVKKKPQVGGIIALNLNHRDEDKMKANDMMRVNCGTNPYKVLEEGEVVIGQKTDTNARENTDYGNKRQVGTFLGMPLTSGSDKENSTNSTASTTQLKEWQITYACDIAKADDTKAVSKASKTKKN